MRQSYESKAEQIVAKSVSAKVLAVAMCICRQTVRSLDDMIDDPDGFA